MKNTSVLRALAKLYERLPKGYAGAVIEEINANFSSLTENTARNGREVLWFMDTLHCEAIYIDTLEFLTEEEIEKELC